ncbi:hypothetical protein BCR36DRAFT_170522 [Piromyces finnis]|uniref:Proteinase inhibitor I42 chagasin domain-containing protein n=1 Tax=Piromyces finnis TaxID=1754191 RepID=A0A1Y1UX96_9FUNG|nr:hypothetical protein BCR36DRAFT_170522 [Piromyces finnis]|eukprot:ORX41843.1 hypothetical protein BCR36DRAFT_170522 [Piromyces finnis]
MKLSTLIILLIIQLVSIVFAETITFKQQGGSAELNVEKNSTFNVELKGNPTTGYSWYLDNVNDIEDAIELLNGDGDYIQDKSKPGMVGVGGTFIFKFQVKKTDKLPTIKFVYKRVWEETSIATAEVILKSNANDYVEAENVVSFTQKGGVQELEVKKGLNFDVKLSGNPTTGYSWYLDNVNDIEDAIELLNGDGDYIQDKSKPGMVGVGGTFIFKFQVKKTDKLPSLRFVYKRIWEETSIATAEVILKSNANDYVEAENVVSFTQKGGVQELEVKKGLNFDVKLSGNPTTGYSWYLDNINDIEDAIELLNGDGDYIPDESKPGMGGVGGAFIFKFQVKKTDKLPSLRFVYKRIWEETSIATAEVILKSNANDYVEAENVVSFTQKGGVQELEVKKGLNFDVKLSGNPTTGYSWYLDNINDIEDAIELLNGDGDYIQDKFKPGMVGVGGTFIFKFQVKKTDKLPSLRFVYKRIWEETFIATAEVILKSNANDYVEAENVVSFTQKGGIQELEVEEGSYFDVKLSGNPTTGYSWYLDNINDIEDAIELLNGDGDYIQDKSKPGMSGVGGTFIFKFQVKKTDKLPSLRFVYKRIWEETSIATAEVILKSNDNAYVEAENVVSFTQKGGVQELEVKKGLNFDVKLSGNPTTGYNWYLDNVNDIEDTIELLNGDGDYIQDKSKPGMVGVGGTFIFKFQVKKTDKLPAIKFVYRRSWEGASIANAKVILKINGYIEAENVVTFTQNSGVQKLEVGEGSFFDVRLPGNPSTGYNWSLDNIDDIKDTVELLKNENGLSDYYYIPNNPDPMLIGGGGSYIFKFQVKKTDKLPTLKFVYKRSWSSDPKSTVEVVLKSNIYVEAENVVTFTQDGGIQELEVEEGSYFDVKLSTNPSTGYNWYLDNADDIKDAIEVLNDDGDYIPDESKPIMPGSGGTIAFQFQVKKTDKLPTLKFVYKRIWEETFIATAEVILKSNDNDYVEAENVVSFTQDGGIQELKVEKGLSFDVKLSGNPTTGFFWFLENARDIKDAIEVLNDVNDNYVPDESKPGMVGVGGTFIFKFQVKETDELPTLKFVYKGVRRQAISTAEVILKDNSNIDDENVVSFTQRGGVQELKVKKGLSFDVKLSGNPTTGFFWFLENARDIKDAIEVLNDVNDNYVPDESKPGMVGVGGTFIFKFQVKETDELPTLKFVYKGVRRQAISTAELNLL